ncbi:MAG: HlyD family secretion protein, partial [Ahrensia sp.]
AGEARRTLVDIAINNLAASEDAVREAHARRDMIAVELKAIKAGTFIGDSYNNVPWSAQRSTEIDLEIARLQIDAETRIRPVADIAPVDMMTTASVATGPIETDITLPQELRVWEVLASHGEIVTAGQPLARMVQCNEVVVTASVDEGLYTRLAIGDPATFRMRGDDRVLDGTVIRLSGMADAAANLAISPVNLEQAPYRVTVSVPAMREDGECAIGKSGRVTFSDAPLFGGR